MSWKKSKCEGKKKVAEGGVQMERIAMPKKIKMWGYVVKKIKMWGLKKTGRGGCANGKYCEAKKLKCEAIF